MSTKDSSGKLGISESSFSPTIPVYDMTPQDPAAMKRALGISTDSTAPDVERNEVHGEPQGIKSEPYLGPGTDYSRFSGGCD